jgi:hypothetical protein
VLNTDPIGGTEKSRRFEPMNELNWLLNELRPVLQHEFTTSGEV